MKENKKRKYFAKNRKAFTMVEMTLVMIVIGILGLGLLKGLKTFKANQEVREQISSLRTMETGMKSSFIDILDAYEPAITASVADGSSNWGWAVNFRRTSPLPVANIIGGIGYLDYRVEVGGISAPLRTNLISKIASNFRGACFPKTAGVPAGTVRLMCPRLKSLVYDVGTAIGSPVGHSLGTSLNSLNIPVVHIGYDKVNILKRLSRKTLSVYDFSMSEVYQARRNLSVRKIATIRGAMEVFVNATLTRELANPRNSDGSGGLNSMDDQFVPWGWKMFGNSTLQVRTSICNKASGNTTPCSNLSTNNIWRSGASAKGLYIRRVVNNFLSGDSGFFVDGFNNPIFIYPFANSCAGSDYFACGIIPPPVPTDNYLNIGRPPFVSVIYTPDFSSKNTIAEDFGRVLVGY